MIDHKYPSRKKFALEAQLSYYSLSRFLNGGNITFRKYIDIVRVLRPGGNLDTHNSYLLDKLHYDDLTALARLVHKMTGL